MTSVIERQHAEIPRGAEHPAADGGVLDVRPQFGLRQRDLGADDPRQVVRACATSCPSVRSSAMRSSPVTDPRAPGEGAAG